MPSIEQLKSQLKKADLKVVAHQRKRPSRISKDYKAWEEESIKLERAAATLRGRLSTQEAMHQARTS